MRTFRNRMGVILIAGLALPWLVGAVEEHAAQTHTYTVDPVHSVTLFKIKHANVSNFYGRFNQTTGTVSYNEKDPGKLALSIEVDIDSIDTHNQLRDKHLEAADYFNLSSFPNATFKSTKAVKTGDKTFDVTGKLTIMGVTKTVTAAVELTGMGPAMRGEGHLIGFEAIVTVKRSDFGMKTSLDSLGDEVKILCAIQGRR